MLWGLVALGSVLLLVGALYAHYRFWVARFTVALPYDLEERVATPDGSAIELRRLPADARTGPPILLVHGLALNHRNHDMLEDTSLARTLAKRGRDVWLLTLRSGRADLRWRERSLVSYERMAEHDLPLAVAEVLRRTGAKTLDYVGYSMGGMLLYGALGRFGALPLAPSRKREGELHRSFAPKARPENTEASACRSFLDPALLHRVVIIGSPARLEPPLRVLALARHLPAWLVPAVPLRWIARMGSFAVESWITPFHRIVYNPDNVERGVVSICLVNGFVDIPALLNADFAHWSTVSRDVLLHGKPVVEGLGDVALPVLFLAGKEDRMAPPAHVRHAFDHWGRNHAGVDKRMRVLGIDEGASGDYGHGDLAIGRFAPEDVFEPVGEFLDEA